MVKESGQNFIEARNKSLPKEIGFFWARGKDFKWCNLFVEIKGEIPYLEFVAWDLFENKLITGKNPKILNAVFVKRIEEPSKKEMVFFE